MTRVLVLRQRPEAEETAEALRALGHEPVLLPLAETVALADAPPAGVFGGFVITSAKAAAPLARFFPGDRRPVLCVGGRTRRAAASAGFPAAEAAAATAGGLVDRACAVQRAGGRALLYAAGRVRTGEFEAAAAAAGLPVAVWEVYDTRPIRPSADAARAAFAARPPDAVLLLSAGQAQGFSALWNAMRPRRPVPRLLCLSERISDALDRDLKPFACISPSPTLSSLFDRHLQPSFGESGAGDDRGPRRPTAAGPAGTGNGVETR